MHAAFRGHARCLELLLLSGADVDAEERPDATEGPRRDRTVLT